MKVSVKNVKNNLFLSVSIIIFMVLFMVSCKVKSQSDLFGTYVADYNVAKEELTLNKDGTFIQKVKLKAKSKVAIAKGKWTYDTKTGYVIFEENHMAVIDGFRKLNPDYEKPNPGPAFFPADKYFGRILLGSAEGVLYEKID